ncbi:ribosome maturation factor RimP [Magnetospirillum sp. 64-120]|uniref:ribosome maturation factor RimP n=1 Tax=Magnetospirillum sp. 64-120 TaxID=1895778 RepID=UPI0009276095|nr:ribosome maturation factor RimP [Magnetospirillum sp. 64-120]OJX81840.1 MAG: ribosome maturation factor RimP [Magnetospirillum sp. 64-120]
MELHQRLEALFGPTLESMGYEMVRVMFQGRTRPTLQVMAERKDGRPMTVDDCADISRSLSALLDVEDPIQGAYALEISSPGIDRPLTRGKDFETWAGFEVKLEALVGVDGRKRFRGKLLGLEAEAVRLLADGQEVQVPLSDIKSAKLVLTDELIAAVTREQEDPGADQQGNE